MKIPVIISREIKLGFRNPWAYSFLALFSFFSLAILSLQSQSVVSGYTHSTGTMIHLILYLLPLMTLLLGSFSITSEKEEGGWQLLATYPISNFSILFGKYIGLFLVLLSIVAFGYGFSGLMSLLFGKEYSFSIFALFFLFSVFLIVLFLGLSLIIGTISRNRWQALTYGVGLWFLLILGWPTILISILGWFPYMWIKPAIEVLTLLNPAELVRIFLVVKLGGGAVFGPDYYQWVDWISQPSGSAIFLIVLLIWVILSLIASIFIWERSRARD